MKKHFLSITTISLAISSGLLTTKVFPQKVEARFSYQEATPTNKSPLTSKTSNQWEALQAQRPSRPTLRPGASGNRESGGRRDVESCIRGNDNPLTALVPENNLGLTVSEYPTFLVYVPPTTAKSADFVLIDEDDNDLYKATWTLNNKPGVISIPLPKNANLPPLQIGKKYRWQFQLICNPQQPRNNLVVSTVIQRIEPSSVLLSQVNKASTSQLSSIYANAGIWVDAVASLAQQRRTAPNNSELSRDWKTLLESVKLNAIAKESLVP